MTSVHSLPLLRSACIFLTVLGLYFKYSYPSQSYNTVKLSEEPVDNKYMTKIKSHWRVEVIRGSKNAPISLAYLVVQYIW
jgi:hypothetical protein